MVRGANRIFVMNFNIFEKLAPKNGLTQSFVMVLGGLQRRERRRRGRRGRDRQARRELRRERARDAREVHQRVPGRPAQRRRRQRRARRRRGRPAARGLGGPERGLRRQPADRHRAGDDALGRVHARPDRAKAGRDGRGPGHPIVLVRALGGGRDRVHAAVGEGEPEAHGRALPACAEMCGSPKLVNTNSYFSAKRVNEFPDFCAYDHHAFPCLAPMRVNQQHRGRLTSKKLRVVLETQISKRARARAAI